jgi:hypothetical protein
VSIGRNRRCFVTAIDDNDGGKYQLRYGTDVRRSHTVPCTQFAQYFTVRVLHIWPGETKGLLQIRMAT